MPELDGLEVVGKLRKEDFRAPIIVMTSDYSEEAVENIKECGSTEHMFKPINKKDLFAIFDKYLPVALETD
jgi:CheY-like chemotaxis protein